MDVMSSRNPCNQSPWHPHPAGSKHQHPLEQDLRNSRQNPFPTRTLPERTSCANRRPSLSFVPPPKDFSGLSLRKVQMVSMLGSVSLSSARSRVAPMSTGRRERPQTCPHSAHSPTGPAPITAVVFAVLGVAFILLDRSNIEAKLHAAVSACRRIEAQSASVQHSSTRKRTSPRITG